MDNRIRQILEDKGFADIIPADDVLKFLGDETPMSRKRFFAILRNESNMYFYEAYAFAKWLNISLEETHEPIQVTY